MNMQRRKQQQQQQQQYSTFANNNAILSMASRAHKQQSGRPNKRIHANDPNGLSKTLFSGSDFNNEFVIQARRIDKIPMTPAPGLSKSTGNRKRAPMPTKTAKIASITAEKSIVGTRYVRFRLINCL